ncbi:MAG: BlaI/MecI/CopY family transcriptional regulator [bacterium]
MKKTKRLAEAEWELMVFIWASRKPTTVREIRDALYPEGEKAYTTVQTITNILVDKGFLQKEKIGMVNFYYPAISKEELAKQETKTLVSRIFEGSFGNLAAYLVDSGELSGTELEKLKDLINQKERGGGES